MLAHIFSKFGTVIDHPLEAIGTFLEYFSEFDWSSFAVTASGCSSAFDLASIPADSLFPDELVSTFRYIHIPIGK